MSAKPRDISELLQKRRQRIRSWVKQDSHPLVVDQVREAHAALGAMDQLLREIAPSMSRLLVDSKNREQELQLERDEQKKRNQDKARQLRLEAQQEQDPEHAEFLEAMARSYEFHIDLPDTSDLRFAGTLLTAAKLYGSADQVSRSRDAEAIKTLGLKAVTTAGKWALKLTPIRQEDLQDLKEAWEALKDLTEPLDDLTAVLEAGKLRRSQVDAASSLFERLQMIRELAEAWCRVALQEPFFAQAIGVDDVDAAWQERLQRARQDWAS